MGIRPQPKYELQKGLPEIGWRSSKGYFQVKDATDPKTEKWVFWLNPGPDFTFDIRSLGSLQKSLSQLQVRHFLPRVYLSFQYQFLRVLFLFSASFNI